jgi:hypothetical protein
MMGISMIFITCQILKRIRWVGHVVHKTMHQNVYRVLAEKPEGKRPLQRLRLRWEDNVKLHLKRNGIRMYGHVGQGTDKWGFLSECSNEPSSSIKSMEFLD